MLFPKMQSAGYLHGTTVCIEGSRENNSNEYISLCKKIQQVLEQGFRECNGADAVKWQHYIYFEKVEPVIDSIAYVIP